MQEIIVHLKNGYKNFGTESKNSLSNPLSCPSLGGGTLINSLYVDKSILLLKVRNSFKKALNNNKSNFDIIFIFVTFV
jgi:hypothetical protein